MESRAFVTALHDAMTAPERIDRTEVVDGVEMRLEFSPSPEVDVRITARPSGSSDEPAVATLYHSASAPPASYPADLPFLAGVPASIWEDADAPSANRSATWWSVPDGAAAEASILEQCASAGWVNEAPPAPGLDLPVRLLVLRQGTRSRMVTLTNMGAASTIMVMDTADASSAGE